MSNRLSSAAGGTGAEMRQLLHAGEGRIAEELSCRHSPDIPVALSCMIDHWHSLFGRAWLQDANGLNLNRG